MRRELLQNTKVQPFVSGGVIERAGFLSGVIGARIGTAGSMDITITHSSDGENFETVTDKQLFVGKQTEEGKFTTGVLEQDDIINIDVDLAGLKGFVKIEVSGDAAAGTVLAFTLGDRHEQPV